MKAKILHILLVEDEASHVDLIRRAFEAQAQEIQLDVVNTLQAAHHHLTEVQPDLAIAELVLPDGRGTELLPTNKDEAAYPMIIIASHGDEQLAVEAMKAGALDYVVKSEAALAAMPRIAARVLREWNHIIERRQTQAALRQSEAILARTEQIVHLGSWEFDLAADEVFWSDEVYRIFGLTPGEIKPNFETAMDFIHADDRNSAINTAKNALASGKSYHIEKRIVRADGQERWIVAYGEPIFSKNEVVVGLTGFLQDITERKQAEEALQRRKQELQDYIDSMSTLSAKVALDGTLLLVNKIAQQASGLPMETLLQTNFLEGHWWAFDPDVQARVRQAFQQACAGIPVNYDEQLFVGDQVLTINFSLVPVIGPDDRVAYIVAEGRDITPLKQAEEALRQSEERYRSLFDYSLDALVIFDDKARYVDVNQAACHLLGYHREAFLQRAIWDLVPPHLQADSRLDWHTFMETGQLRGEYELWCQDETIIQVEYRAIANVIPGLHLAVMHDITERKQAEEEIRRRNRELALLNRVIAASAARPDPAAILETVCQELPLAFEVPWAAAALIDNEQSVASFVAQYVSEGNLLPLPPPIFVADLPVYQYMRQHKEPVTVVDAQNDPRLATIRSIFRERGVVSLLIIPFIVENHFVGGVGLGTLEARYFSTEEMRLAQSVADQVGGVLARAQLEKEHRRLAAEYQQVQKMEAIGQLAAGIAHDFNNILTVMMGFAELLSLDLARNDPDRDVVNKILKSGQQATDLVRQLLAFSRKQVIRPQVVSLNDIVAGMDEMLRRTIHENIVLETGLASDLWPIKADPVQIEQVIINLAVNARDAMPDGGRLTIETANLVLDQEAADRHIGSKPGDYVLLTITDTGHGMSAEVKERIFEPFFTTKATGKGTGLGLATVFGIVKQSGGNIEVISEEGIGTSFRICLPRTREVSPPPIHYPTPKAEQSVGNQTILVVEDNPEVRELAQSILQEQGYTLLSAQDGPTALELAASHQGPIDLLLTDIVMPGMSGQTLAKQLIEMYPGLRVVYMSGYTDKAALPDRALQVEAIFLQKPFRPTTLAHKIQAILGHNKENLV